MGKYPHKLVWAGILFLMLVFGAVNCSEKNEGAPYENNVHTRNWSDLTLIDTDVFHGFDVKLEGVLECVKCHDIYDSGKAPIPGCFVCHFGPTGSKAPVGSGWLHGNNDGHKDFENKNATCSQCHSLNRSYGNGPGICHDCHGSGETHVLGQLWLDRSLPDYHGNQPQQECANCHNLSTSCSECHFGPTGLKSPPGSGWTHGTIDNHNDQETYINVCNSCHFLSRSYRGEPDSSCHDCHED